MMKAIRFGCGHNALVPYQAFNEKWTKYWNDQGIPSLPGGVARCPGCITKARPRGEIQKVLAVSDLSSGDGSEIPFDAGDECR